MGRHSSEDDGAQPDALDVDDAPERDREADETPEASDDAETDEDEEDDEDDDAPKGKAKERVEAESEDAEEPDAADFEDEDDTEVAAPVAEIAEADIDEAPRFLTADGKLLLFDTPAALAAFVRENRDHDLADLDKWDDVVTGIKDEWVVPNEEDAYELDLVVENLRGGHDAWDHELIISAGELARDLAYALQLKSVLTALAPGSPIDDLDDALRAVEAGGFGGFFAKRRLRKIGAQQASLAWRSIIGKISAAVDWRK